MTNARLVMRWVGLVALPLMLLGSIAHADVTFSGYTQVRFNHFDGNTSSSADPSDNQFQIRRTRLKAVATVADDTTFTMQWDFANLVADTTGATTPELKDAFIARRLAPEWVVTGGYTQMPFGYEVPSSDAVNLTFEKSAVMNTLFPGERDTGVYVHYKGLKTDYTPMFDLGYSDGPHKWYNPDASGNRDKSSHVVVGRAQVSLPCGGVAGASYMWA